MKFIISVESQHFGTGWCEDSNNRCRFLNKNIHQSVCILFEQNLAIKADCCKPCPTCVGLAKRQAAQNKAWIQQQKEELRKEGLL